MSVVWLLINLLLMYPYLYSNDRLSLGLLTRSLLFKTSRKCIPFFNFSVARENSSAMTDSPTLVQRALYDLRKRVRMLQI